MIIHAPHQFPQGIRYAIFSPAPAEHNPAPAVRPPGKFAKRLSKILGTHKWKKQPEPSAAECEPQIALRLKALLTKFCPGSECIGFQDDPAASINAHHIVLFTGDYRRQKALLLAQGWKEEKLLFMPVPESDYWAYWNYADLITADVAGKVDCAATFADPAFLNRLLAQHVLVADDNRLAYRRHKDFSRKGLKHGRHLYPFPSFETDLIASNKAKIERVQNALSDDCSRSIYNSVLFGKPHERFQHYAANTLANLQYFEYITLAPGDCILNAGIARGAEIPFFCAHLADAGQIHCIDPSGFDDLSPYVRHFREAYASILVEHRYVVCDRSEGVCPDPLVGDFSNCTPMSIDGLAEREKLSRVDLIKTDCEGMDALVLKKMAKTVERFRPQLAIAVYHETEHFWDLPLHIIDMCKDYNFYFNIYSPTHFEGIFYAIPQERAGNRLGKRII